MTDTGADTYRKFIPGKGFVESAGEGQAASAGATTGTPGPDDRAPSPVEQTYDDEREAAAMAIVGARMNKILGRRARSLTDRRAERKITGGEPGRTESSYRVLRR